MLPSLVGRIRMLCIFYVVALGVGLGGVGLLVERTLPASWPRRWVWCAVLAVSMIVPGVKRAHHTVAIDVASGGSPATRAGLLAPLEQAWRVATASVDAMIEPLWLLASAGLLAWGLLSTAWVARLSRGAGRTRGDGASARSAVVDDVPVLVTDALGPATVGVLRPRVLLPRWVLALPAAERRYVVRHEEEHRRAHDARLLGLASLALLVAPWNLALWWHLRRLHLAVETDCDRRVVRALGDAHAYGALLLRVAEAASRGPRVPPLRPALLGRPGMLERRLTVLLRPAPRAGAPRLVPPLLLALLAGGLLAGLLWLPHPVPGRAAAHPTGSHAGAGPAAGAHRSASR